MPIVSFQSIPPTFEIPTFTVTINPLESNEMTYVPDSPPEVQHEVEDQPLLTQDKIKDPRLIANMTVIVDDEVNDKLLVKVQEIKISIHICVLDWV